MREFTGSINFRSRAEIDRQSPTNQESLLGTLNFIRDRLQNSNIQFLASYNPKEHLSLHETNKAVYMNETIYLTCS